MANIMLKCSNCGKIKPLLAFGPNKTSSTGRQTHCRDCKNANFKKNMRQNLSLYINHHFSSRISVNLGNLCPDDIHTRLEHYLGYKLSHLVHKLDKGCLKTYGFNLKVAIHDHDFHIDHVKPLVYFHVINELGVDWSVFRLCWAMDNLEAIPAAVNLSKGSRYIEPGNAEQ